MNFDNFLSSVQEAYVELMDGPSLFESMYSDDAEGQKMKEMPGVDELMMLYPLIINTVHLSFQCGHFVKWSPSVLATPKLQSRFCLGVIKEDVEKYGCLWQVTLITGSFVL